MRQVARLNRFAESTELDSRFPRESRQRLSQDSDLSPEWVELPQGSSLEPAMTRNGLADCYVMDLASVMPPLALGVGAGEDVLDMCAAPGGKSLILAEALADSGRLVANEISDNRRGRLLRVIREYLPPSLSGRVQVTGHNAERWCLVEPDRYDRILLDAPCSGERHLLTDAAELKKWSEARSKNLAVRQYALLASALGSVRPGGRIVYSTCALSPRENDDLISRLLKRRLGEATVLSPTLTIGERSIVPPFGEPTEHGWTILPDRTGYGPIYFAVLQRS